MILSLKKHFYLFIGTVCTITAITSCNKDISISLDSNRDESVGLVPIDTNTVKVSTFRLKDIPTANAGTLLVGKTSNPITGSVTSSSYFRLSTGNFSSASLPDGAVYDSLTLRLPINKYYYGDTTQNQRISVYRLTEDIVQTPLNPNASTDEQPVFVNSATIFSNQTFARENTPLGTTIFKPHVTKNDTISIALNNVLGKEIFDLLDANDMQIQNNTNFQEYFKGMVIEPGQNNTALIGFKDSVSVVLHYSFINNDGKRDTASQYLNMGSKAFQFNHIQTDQQNTQFAALATSKNSIPSEATNGNTYLEGSTGVVTKIEFPYLADFVRDPNILINKAELVIETENGANTIFALPSALNLMIANEARNPFRMITVPFRNTPQNATFIGGNDYGGNAAYKFNMIEYLNLIKNSTYNKTSLYLTLPTTQLFSTGNRMIVAKDKFNIPKIKLNILYTKF